MAIEQLGVAPLEAKARERPQRAPFVLPPVPVELAVDVGVLAGVEGDLRTPVVGGEDSRQMPLGAQMAHRPPPDDLVPAQEMRGIDVADRQDTKGGRHRARNVRSASGSGSFSALANGHDPPYWRAVKVRDSAVRAGST